MRKTSTSILPYFCALIILITTSAVASAQSSSQTTRDRFVISARAGGVNAATGKIGVHARGSSTWQQLTIKDNLQGGDVVRTGFDGRVEILLNPGSYMRVAENSEFELTNNSLDNLEVRLISGTAIVEATGAENTELLINITTPHTKMAIVRRGLYRVNVVPGDLTELIIRKGRVLLGDPETKVKAGKKLIFSGGTYSVAKLTDADKKDVDSFGAWSKQRAQMVAKANQRVTRRDRNLLVAGFNDEWSRRFSPRFGGFWFFEPSLGCFTFMPFYAGWGSPYGSSYSSSFYGGYWWMMYPLSYPTNRGWMPDVSSRGTGATPGVKDFPGGSSTPAPTKGGSYPKSGGKTFP